MAGQRWQQVRVSLHCGELRRHSPRRRGWDCPPATAPSPERELGVSPPLVAAMPLASAAVAWRRECWQQAALRLKERSTSRCAGDGRAAAAPRLEGCSGWLRFFGRLTSTTGLGIARVPGPVSFSGHSIGYFLAPSPPAHRPPPRFRICSIVASQAAIEAGGGSEAVAMAPCSFSCSGRAHARFRPPTTIPARTQDQTSLVARGFSGNEKKAYRSACGPSVQTLGRSAAAAEQALAAIAKAVAKHGMRDHRPVFVHASPWRWPMAI